MGFLAYDITFFVLFSLFVVLFLYFKRDKIKREGIIFLYKSKFGLKVIDYIGTKYKKLLSALELPMITICYISMVVMIYLLFKIAYTFLNFPEVVRAVKIPPILPLIPYIPEIFKVEFLPHFYFTYWIIVLGVTAIFHEFFHGIFSKKNNVKIKTTGFYFLGPFTGAFVEPDEKKVDNLGFREQAAIFGAGSFANWILTVIFFLIMWGFFAAAFQPSGVIFNSYDFKLVNYSDIQEIKGQSYLQFNGGINLTEITAGNKTFFVKNITKEGYMVAFENSPALKAGLRGVITSIDSKKIRDYDELRSVFLSKKPGDKIVIETLYDEKTKSYEITLGQKNNRSYLGIILIDTSSKGAISRIRAWMTFFKDPNTYYAPKALDDLTIFIYNLIWWMVFINLSVALGNMLPLGIFDGGRFFYITIRRIFKSENIAKKFLTGSTYLFLFIFLLLMVAWAFSVF